MDRESGHTPVLRNEVVDLLSPEGRSVLVDCTIGLAGHAKALLEAADADATLIGLDVDEANLRFAKEVLGGFAGRIRLFKANFSQLGEVLREAGVAVADVVLADLGLCSDQISDPARGFSFAKEGPLDMRMDMSIVRTARDIIRSLNEKELADLIYTYGQERYSRRIARAITTARKVAAINTTTNLARIVENAYPRGVRRSRRGVHPATRTFQALRIAVNDEMGHLGCLLDSLDECLSLGGRAAVISFHSLEDRRVKQAFARMAGVGVARTLTDKPVTPSAEEVQRNPRSRSAKLRAIERIS